MEIQNVTFIGLGVMGYNMAGHLKKNNFNTTVYNRTSSISKNGSMNLEESQNQLQEMPLRMLTLCVYVLDEMRI